jgi:serine/threonine protein kinase
MSALQIGCYVKKVNGFDFIVHDSFIEFHMERCNTFDPALIEEEMKRNLLLMHSLKICHMDVSPKNIMYSPTFEKWVFIDFGLSRIVKENINEKSFTGFCGTYEFCSSDMASLFRKDSVGWVNLYLNDVWGLKESLKKMKNA